MVSRRVTRYRRPVNTVGRAPVPATGAGAPPGPHGRGGGASMVSWLVGSAVRLRLLVVAAVVAVLAFGVVQLQKAPVDVYPEFQDTQVEVQAEALGLSAQEVEQLITVPIEQDLLNGVPWMRSITSRSMPSLSVIDLKFEPGTDLYRARQMVQERMSQA